MIKHVVFDFDGTLADSEALIVDVYNGLAGKYRLRPICRDEYKALVNLSMRERLKALRVPMRRFFLIRKIGGEFKAAYRQGLGGVRMFPEMAETLSDLKREGYLLAVISSNDRSNITDYLAASGLTAFGSVHSSGGLYGKHRTISRYLRTHRLKPEEMMYVGDETRDIEACRKAGIGVIAVTWGLESRERLAAAGPDYIAAHPREVTRILSAIRQAADS